MFKITYRNGSKTLTELEDIKQVNGNRSLEIAYNFAYKRSQELKKFMGPESSSVEIISVIQLSR